MATNWKCLGNFSFKMYIFLDELFLSQHRYDWVEFIFTKGWGERGRPRFAYKLSISIGSYLHPVSRYKTCSRVTFWNKSKVKSIVCVQYFTKSKVISNISVQIWTNSISNQILEFPYLPTQSANQLCWSGWNYFWVQLLSPIFTNWEKIELTILSF